MAKDQETGKELQRIHLFLDPDDVDWIDHTFGETLGRSKAIRMIIAKYRKAIDEKVNQKARPLPTVELDLGGIK